MDKQKIIDNINDLEKLVNNMKLEQNDRFVIAGGLATIKGLVEKT